MSRKLDAADKIDDSIKKYFQSEKGKTALAKTQKKYYRTKKKPERELVKAFRHWLEQHPDRPIEDFLKEINGDT